MVNAVTCVSTVRFHINFLDCTVDVLLKDGGLTLNSLFDTMCLRLRIYLQEIGLVQKSLVGMDLAKAAYTFCSHHVSHYLEMDVHDTSSVSRSIHLKPGMICTTRWE